MGSIANTPAIINIGSADTPLAACALIIKTGSPVLVGVFKKANGYRVKEALSVTITPTATLTSLAGLIGAAGIPSDAAYFSFTLTGGDFYVFPLEETEVSSAITAAAIADIAANPTAYDFYGADSTLRQSLGRR